MNNNTQNKGERYVVRGVHAEVPGVVTLALTREDGTVPHFTEGQYINIFFPDELEFPILELLKLILYDFREPDIVVGKQNRNRFLGFL